MHGKEETMNTSITPPEQPATVSEAPLPPRGNHPKWMVPAIAAGCAIVLAASGAGGYAWWSHDRLASASGECSAAHAKAVRAQGKLTDYLESDALKAAVSVKTDEVKDAKTVAVLASSVKAASESKTAVPGCPSGSLTDIRAVSKELEGFAAAYSKTVKEVKGKADAVDGSKLDRIVADASKLLSDSKGKVKDDKIRTALADAIKTRDADGIEKAVKTVSDSMKAKSDDDANAEAEKAKQTADNAAQAQTDNSGSYTGGTTGGYTGYTGGGYTQSQGGYAYTPQQSTGGGYTPTPQPQPTPQPSQGGGNGGSNGGDGGWYEDSFCGVLGSDPVPC